MNMGSFFQGAAEAGSADAIKRRENALMMKMQSAQLEQAAAIHAKQFQDESMLDPKFSQSLRDQSGLGGTGALSNAAGGIAAGLIRNTQTADAKKSILSKRAIRTQVVRTGNDVFLLRIDAEGNELGRTNLGVNPTSMREVAKIDTEWAPSNVIIDKLDKSVHKILTSGTLLQSYPQGVKTRLSVLVQNNDPEAIALTKASDAFGLWLTAAVSGKQMTQREQEAMKKLIPDVSVDTIENAEVKLGLLSDMISAKREVAMKSYGVSAKTTDTSAFSESKSEKIAKAAAWKAARESKP